MLTDLCNTMRHSFLQLQSCHCYSLLFADRFLGITMQVRTYKANTYHRKAVIVFSNGCQVRPSLICPYVQPVTDQA